MTRARKATATAPASTRATAHTRVRRVFTETALARQYDRLIAGRPLRKVAKIPWSSFDRERYTPEARRLAEHAQTMLALGEYTAVDLFARMSAGLARNGAPFDLVAAATRVPCDEIRHAEYTLRFASMIAGRDVSVEFDPALIDRQWKKPMTLDDLDRFVVEIAAIGETLACALIGACHDRAKDPVARAVLGTVLADEVHHARLGWYYLSWRAPQWTLAQRQRVADAAGAVVMDTERRFWRGRDAASPVHARSASALGVLDSKSQRRAVKHVMEDEIVPALDAFGLGASHAWRARTRMSAS
jgi:hypothetical protein